MGNIVRVRLNLDSSFKLGSDMLTIELYDILGRKVATLLDGTIGVARMDITKNCSLFPNGKYICRIVKATSSGITTQSLSFIIDR